MSILDGMRAIQASSALHHQDITAKPKRCAVSFHSSHWFNTGKVSSHPLWKKFSVCSWIYRAAYTAHVAIQATARRATKLHTCNLHIARYWPLTFSHGRWLFDILEGDLMKDGLLSHILQLTNWMQREADITSISVHKLHIWNHRNSWKTSFGL